MKILKYLLIAGILLALYITEPLWRVRSNTNTADISQIDKKIKEQQDERNALLAAEAEKLRKLEEKFGEKPSVAYKSRVPEPLQEYWDKTLGDTDSIYEDICSPLKAGSDGWTTTCQYKVKSKNGSSELRLDTYIIKNGKIVKQK
ncbi:MAG: hypothetical protein P794_03200 [Epsilonproteobacteria bacterium (ex Lamellibrachia satsuma)]|nr:MAG: hypothetical protein P794_03200 [Epsilonproteobacteria bacterium (ex Lamellibrachia satsuma)]